jgi:hypothetical protein
MSGHGEMAARLGGVAVVDREQVAALRPERWSGQLSRREAWVTAAVFVVLVTGVLWLMW